MPKFFDQTLIVIQQVVSGTMTPTIILSTDTFTIAVNTQMLFVIPCRKDGTMIIDGDEVIED